VTLKTVTSLAEAEHFLFEALPKSPKTLFKHGKGIERSRIFFDLIDNPQNKFKSIHIAATSGKGSTSHILDELLRAHGKTTGLHVSPHVYDYRERMIVNGELISEQELIDALNSLMPAIEQMDNSEAGRPTYFEVSNALAFSIFAKHNVDYAVIETGLGGLNDSTNTIERQDKLAVIGQIGEDHVDILAEPGQLVDAAANKLLPESFTDLTTIIECIAVQKAGIMPFSGVALALRQRGDVNAVFQAMADYRSADLQWVVRRKLSTPLNLPGDFQYDNASLALSAAEYLAHRDNWTIDPDLVKEALGQVSLPGRFEIRHSMGKTFILDGSHNPQKMWALVRAFQDRFPGQRATIIAAMARTKDAKGILEALDPIAKTIVCTDFFTERQDFKSASLKPNDLAELARQSTDAAVEVADDHQDALNKALASDSDIILITGSFYFLGEINTLLV
jgi:dihydrofolate synthase/folylpolyglutamate synthase